jgi:predicted RND superfamily exporter protein
MVESYAAWIVRWRWLVLLLCLASVALLASGGKFLTFTNDYRVFFSEGNPYLEAFENLQDTYTKNDNVLIMLAPRSGNVFTPEVLTAVVDLTDRAWQTPYSTRVDSLSNFQHTYAEEDDLVVIDLVEEPEALTEADLNYIRQVAVNEPLLVDRIISPEGHVTGVNITVQLPGIDQGKEVPEIVAYIRPLLDKMREQYPQIDFYVTGIVMMNNAFPEASQDDMKNLVPFAFLAIIVGLIVFVRSISGTVGTLVVIIMSIMAAMGSAGWLGIKLTPPSASAPLMILTLAVADCVHFLTNYVHGMRDGHSKHQAIIESLRINFFPIFLTSLTTVIGFLSLNFSDAPPFRDLGNITAMGVTYAFVLSVAFLPALVAVLPARIKPGKQASQVSMIRLAEYVINKRRSLLIVVGLVALILTAMVPRNELNDVFVEYFDRSINFRTHTDMVADNLTGMYFIDYSIPAGNAGGVSDPEFLQKVHLFADWMRSQPEVLHVNTITDTFKRLNRNMHGDSQEWYRLPEERDLAAQYLLLYEMSLPYGLDLNNQINIDKSATRISVTLKTISSNEVLELEQRVQRWFKDNAPELAVKGASPTIMFANIGQRNIESMLVGTSVALVLISFVLIFALRSFKLGMISLVPNLLPAGVAFGLWAIFVGEVGLALSVVAAMSLGIVVDDSVHFLSKFVRARREKGLDVRDAVRYAFSTVGVALVVTTLVLFAGFMVLAQSAFELNAAMGLLTGVTIVIALVLDFLLLPPILIATEEKKL